MTKCWGLMLETRSISETSRSKQFKAFFNFKRSQNEKVSDKASSCAFRDTLSEPSSAKTAKKSNSIYKTRCCRKDSDKNRGTAPAEHHVPLCSAGVS